MRPNSRIYADLEGILVHFDPPARTISIIANPKIHFHDLHYVMRSRQVVGTSNEICHEKSAEVSGDALKDLQSAVLFF